MTRERADVAGARLAGFDRPRANTLGHAARDGGVPPFLRAQFTAGSSLPGDQSDRVDFPEAMT